MSREDVRKRDLPRLRELLDVDEPCSARTDFVASHLAAEIAQECDETDVVFWDLYWSADCSLAGAFGTALAGV